MKGTQHPRNDVTINPSGNESIHDVIDRTDPGRRTFLKTAVSASVLASLGGVSLGGLVRAVEAAPIAPGPGFPGIGFESIPPSVIVPPATSIADEVRVPAGYRVEVLASWGDPILPRAPDWLEDASQDASAQAMQFGMHVDGSHFFAYPQSGRGRGTNPVRGLLCVNHEYTHEEILHGDQGLEYVAADPAKGITADLGKRGSVLTVEKIRKSQAAHGVSVVEVRKNAGTWQVARNSPFARRITANTPMRISGPAAGHDLLKVKEYRILPDRSEPTGRTTDGTVAWGTANNCAHGYTPWGTYLACEENWNGYFGWKEATKSAPSKLESRYGISRNGFVYGGASSSTVADAKYSIYKWYQRDDRWDTAADPNSANTFGWRVEIDPFDPDSTPVKRTALGRFKCESAQHVTDDDNAVAFYMGDDERNEYIYKFVCERAYNPRNRRDNLDLLDQGTLYVAKFTSDPVAGKPGNYRGVWIALRPETVALDGKPLRENPEFRASSDPESLALILIKTRMAADAVGATMMDRPEWTAARPRLGGFEEIEVYCTLTNNNRRGSGGANPSSNRPDGSTAAGSARPAVDVANPRPDNDYGHIIRWREDGRSVRATGFEWDIFVLCGDSAVPPAKTVGSAYSRNNFLGVDASTIDPGYSKRMYEGNIVDNPAGSADFGAPDGMWFDYAGRLWVQTDQAGDAMFDWANLGSNAMVCADPNTKEVRRFLTSPPNCEVTGVVTTPDGTAMFVGIQHPGEDSTASDPTQFSNWPQSQFVTNASGDVLPNTPGRRRPRSSVLVITKLDGGVVGT